MRVIRRFIDFCHGYYWHVLLSAGLATLLAGWIASGLTIDSNLERLLPQSAPSVASLDHLEDSYAGHIGRLTVVLEGAETDRLKTTSDELAAEIARLDGIDRVESTRPTTFFWDYRFLYADYEDIVEVRKRFEKRIRWEKQRANPLFVDVSDEKPPEVDISDITEQYEVENGLDAHYLNEAGDKVVLFVYPSISANALGEVRPLVDRVDRAVGDFLSRQGDSIDYGLTGRYKKRIDLQELLTSDLATATLLAAVALLVFLLILLRSFSGAIVVLAPLLIGVVWTFAWAEVAFDSLNILTGFLGAIILGLGVDYGLHLYFRYHELNKRLPTPEALTRTLDTSGRANIFAGVTTMVPMATLLISDFQAFFEFGVIALGGIALVLFAYTILFSCFVFAFDRFGFHPNEPLSTLLVESTSDRLPDDPDRRHTIFRRLMVSSGAILAAISLVALVGLPDVRFNRDFYVLQSTDAPSWRLDEMVNEMLGQSQTPTVVLTDSPAHSRRVVDELQRRKREWPAGRTIDQVVSLQEMLPDRQADKTEQLQALRQTFRDLPDRAREGELAEYLQELDRTLDAAPLTRESLPEKLTDPFSRVEPAPASVVLVFPAVDLTAMDNVEDFIGVTRNLPDIEYPRAYDSISESALLYDIIRYVERDSVRMLGLTLVGLLLVSMLAFRRLRDSLIQFGILGLSILSAIGWIGLVGVEFNFLNVIILPIWLGLGIDATFHMILDLRRDPDDLRTHLTTGLAVGAAFLTTMLGFGATLVAHHDGLYSLGEVAVWGLGLVLVVNLFIQLFRVARRQTGRSDKEPS